MLAEAAAPCNPLLDARHFNRLAALPYAAIPVATAISLQSGWPVIYPRKEAKSYGLRAEVEGEYHAGERAVVIDDLATTGGSKFEIIDKLTEAGLQVKDVVVLIDRQSGAREALAEAGELADRPGLAGVHRGVRTSGERRKTGIAILVRIDGRAHAKTFPVEVDAALSHTGHIALTWSGPGPAMGHHALIGCRRAD